jgi:hypothetical protein
MFNCKIEKAHKEITALAFLFVCLFEGLTVLLLLVSSL